MDALNRYLAPQGALFNGVASADDRRIIPPAVGAEILGELAAQLDDRPQRAKPSAVAEHVLLVDSRALLDAAYYATRDDDKRNPSGMPNGGISGYASGLIQVLQRVKPSHVLATFDHPAGSDHRKRILPSYKGNRDDKSLEHLAQIDVAMRLTRTLGITTVCTPAGEADDVLATVCARCPEDTRVSIYSPDKDLLQLLGRPHTRTIWRRRDEWNEAIGNAGALARLGVRAHQVADYLALVGDTSDNVPGCNGIGEKTAQRLLAKHSTLHGVAAAINRLDVPRAEHTAKLLRAGWNQVLVALSVVKLAIDLDDAQLPRDAWDVQDDLRWTWGHADLDGLERIASEAGVSWLSREAQALRADREDADRSIPPRSDGAQPNTAP